MVDFLAELYRVGPSDFAPFREAATLSRASAPFVYSEDRLVAAYPATGDGVDVEVWSSAMPARFYEVRAEGRTVLSTGGGVEMAHFAHTFATHLADGMITAEEE